MRQRNAGGVSDSFLTPESDHSSFLKSTETSFVSVPTKRRRSIRRSDYDSLLLSESKRLSTYSSLFQSSVNKSFSPDVLQSLQMQPKLNDLSVSSISGSRMDSTLQDSELVINESKENMDAEQSKHDVENEKEKEKESKVEAKEKEEEEEKKGSVDEISVGMDHGVDEDESIRGEIKQPSIEIQSEEREEEEEEESKESRISEEPKSVEEEKEEEESEEEKEEKEKEEENEPEEEEEEEEEKEEESKESEEESEEEKEQEQQEDEEEEENEPQEEEKEESQHSIESAESAESISAGDIPFANSQEERTLRELLIPSQPSELGEATSLLEPSLMPPPSSSLSSRLRIPNRTKIHTHRKSSESFFLLSFYVCRSGEMSLALIKKLVMANCNRRVGKEVFEEVNHITSEFFDVCIGAGREA